MPLPPSPTWRVGSDLANPPFALVEDDGTVRGRDVERAEALARSMGVDLIWERMDFARLLYTAPDAWSIPTFHPAARITNSEVAKLLFTIRSRVLRLCRRRGLMGEEGELGTGPISESQGLLPLLCAASIQGRSALGSETGARIERRGTPEASVPGRAVVVKELC